MIRMSRIMITVMIEVTVFAGFMTGCGKDDEPMYEEPMYDEPLYDGPEAELYDAEFEDDMEYPEDAYYDEYVEEPDGSYEENSESGDPASTAGLSNDQIVELARKHSGAPAAELDQVMDNGNLFIHLYENMEDHTATIDWYEIDPKTLKGTNFEGEAVDLSGEASSGSKGDAKEAVSIADGEYVTDAEYQGELSADGKTMTITTALSEFVNSPSPAYPRQTYVITVADSCKCVEVQEETKESSFFDKMDLIRDFLKGQSGLPITLKFKNNELVEILFSS